MGYFNFSTYVWKVIALKQNIAELFLFIIGSVDQWKPNVIHEVEKT